MSTSSNNIKKDNDVIDDNNDDDIESDEEVDEVVIDQNDTDDIDGKLLFIYQSRQMKRLYHRYGCHTIFLDATYRTTKYALPLFFLVVKTNVNYQVFIFLHTLTDICLYIFFIGTFINCFRIDKGYATISTVVGVANNKLKSLYTEITDSIFIFFVRL